MSLINFSKTYNIFKKKYKKFLILNFIFLIIFTLANQTIFKEKLDKVFDVTFDYKYKNSWGKFIQKKIEFSYMISNLTIKKESKKDHPFPFRDLEELYSTYFSLLYRYNLEDIKGNDFKSKNRKIATAFNFDTANFTFKNKKIHVAWYNQEEAENYLESLHLRSAENIENTLIFSLKQQQTKLSKQINDLFMIYPVEDIKKKLIRIYSGANKSFDVINGIDGINGIETNKFFEKKIKQSNYDKMSDDQLVSKLQNTTMFFIDAQLINEKNSLLIYYFMKKFENSDNYKNLILLPKYKLLIDEIENFLPNYIKISKKVNYGTFYFVELLLGIIISLLITFAPIKLKTKN